MLGHLPHATLYPTYPSTTDGIPPEGLQVRPPPRTANRPWNALHRSDNAKDSALILASSRSRPPFRASTFLPLLKLPRDRSVSPESVFPEEPADLEHRCTGQKAIKEKVDTKPKKLASWFTGSSEPVNITLIPSPVKEKQDPFCHSAEMERESCTSSIFQEVNNMTKRPQSRLQKNISSLSIAKKDAAGSKFAFWRSRPNTSSEKSIMVEGELTGFDVQAALFPLGMPDQTSSEAFKKLQANAENAICLFQSAYQESLHSVREVTSERNILTDELKAAQTRSDHLKLQLANMAAQAARQESAMQTMAEELVALRCKIREDAEFRSKSLRIVTREPSDAHGAETIGNSCRRRKRQSAESFTSEESSSDSVFSQASFGTCTPISAADTGSELHRVQSFGAAATGTGKECQNCRGIRRSEAWDVVHLLREESRILKARVARCESANEDALSLLEVVSTIH